MGITRDTVWCVICDRESIVTRTHKQICYIHWSRTIDLRVPHLAQHVPPVVVNIICYQWWDESVVAGLPLSRHNLIKLLPATPRGISLYIIQATEVSLKLEYFCISIFLSIRDHKMNVLRYFLASASQGSVLSWYWVQILFIIIN